MLRIFLVAGFLVIFAVPLLRAETLFFDDFEDGRIDDAFQFTGQGPEFVEENGVLTQKTQVVGDACYAVIADKEYPEVLTIQAKLRVDEWKSGPYARTGVGVRVSIDTGEGIAFLFSDHRVAKPQTGVAFLDDHVAWGPLENYEWEMDTWYWFQFHIDQKGELHSKIWQDGEAEPKDWMWDIASFGVNRVEGYPGLNASSGGGDGVSIPSFDSVEVWDEGGPTPKAIEPSDKLAITWAGIKSNS